MLALDSAAVRTTKFISEAAAGTWAAASTRTKGLASTLPPCAVTDHGAMVSTMVIARM